VNDECDGGRTVVDDRGVAVTSDLHETAKPLPATTTNNNKQQQELNYK